MRGPHWNNHESSIFFARSIDYQALTLPVSPKYPRFKVPPLSGSEKGGGAVLPASRRSRRAKAAKNQRFWWLNWGCRLRTSGGCGIGQDATNLARQGNPVINLTRLEPGQLARRQHWLGRRDQDPRLGPPDGPAAGKKQWRRQDRRDRSVELIFILGPQGRHRDRRRNRICI